MLQDTYGVCCHDTARYQSAGACRDVSASTWLLFDIIGSVFDDRLLLKLVYLIVIIVKPSCLYLDAECLGFLHFGQHGNYGYDISVSETCHGPSTNSQVSCSVYAMIFSQWGMLNVDGMLLTSR